MYTSSILLEKEKKQREKLQRMRMLEEERKKRIFNPKQRMIGIDVRGLETQLNEQKSQKDLEKAIENKYHQRKMYALAEADKLEKQIIETRREINQEINNFRKNVQRKNVEDENERNRINFQTKPGISSGLLFDGEDSGAHNRKKTQIQQQKCWLQQQISEKKQLSKELCLADKLYCDSLRARENRALNLENLEKDCRKQMASVVSDYNETLAKEQSFTKTLNGKKEREDMERDVTNAMTSELLNENPDVAQSNLGLEKIIQYQYKGMPERERNEIRKAQMEQIKEKQAIANTENIYDQKWDNFYKEMDRIHLDNDELYKNEEREKYRLLMEKNKLLSFNSKANASHRKREDASYYSTPLFLSQFNKTSR